MQIVKHNCRFSFAGSVPVDLDASPISWVIYSEQHIIEQTKGLITKSTRLRTCYVVLSTIRHTESIPWKRLPFVTKQIG